MISIEDAYGNPVSGEAANLAVSIGGANNGATISAIVDITNYVMLDHGRPMSLVADSGASVPR